MPMSRYHSNSHYITCIMSVTQVGTLYFYIEKCRFIILLITDNGPGPWQEERGNLIYFYNQVYMTMMQHFAKQFAPTPGVSEPF